MKLISSFYLSLTYLNNQPSQLSTLFIEALESFSSFPRDHHLKVFLHMYLIPSFALQRTTWLRFALNDKF